MTKAVDGQNDAKYQSVPGNASVVTSKLTADKVISFAVKRQLELRILSDRDWHNLGPAESLKDPPLRELTIGRTSIALSYKDGQFGAISNVCNHVGGPLGRGMIDGDYVKCPWHNWKFHRVTGFGEPGFEDDRVPQYELKMQDGDLYINLRPITQRNKAPTPASPSFKATKARGRAYQSGRNFHHSNGSKKSPVLYF